MGASMPVQSATTAVLSPERVNLQGVRSVRASLALGVWGEPGVGKTHWVDALLGGSGLAQVRVPARVTVSQLVQRIPVGRPRPLWLEKRVRELLTGNFGEAKEQAEVVAALLALSAPIALHVEDLHSADESSSAFWSALAGFVRHAKGVALLATTRSAPSEGFQPLRLEPLTPEASATLLESTLNATLPEDAKAWLHASARGNALFALEYLRFATRQGWLWSDGQRWRWRAPSERDQRPPTSLEGLLAQVMVDAAPSAQGRATLEARAVLPDGVAPAVWRATAALTTDEFDAALATLERHGVVVAGAFTHPLYREVVLARLEPKRKASLAGTALGLLLDQGDAASRAAAVRLLEYAAVPAPVALALLQAAVRDAVEAGDALEAALLEAQAVAYADAATRGALALRAARTLRAARPGEALRLARIAHADGGSLESGFLLAELLVLNGEGAAADALVDTLGATVREAAWLPRLIALRVQRLDFASALALWHDHPALHATAGPLLRRDVAWAMIQFGEFEPADGLLESALQTNPPERERGAILMAQAYRRLLGGELRLAQTLAAEAVALLDTGAASLDLARALEIRAEVLENQGSSLEASTLSVRALSVRSELGDAWGVCRAQLRLSSALLELEEYERSEELLLESRAVLERRDAREALIVWDCQLAHLYAEWNPPHGASLALRHARDAVRRAREGIHPTMLNSALAQAAWVEAWYGDPARALTLSDEALDIATSLGQSDQSGLETMARGAALEGLGRTAEAREMYAGGVAQLRDAGLASAERYALELDRLTNNVNSAESRIEGFARRGQRHAINVARRYFPQLRPLPPPSAQAADALEVQVLGAVRVTRGAQGIRVQSDPGKALLAMLLEARLDGRFEIPDLELIERLYPDLNERRARDNLKNLVYRLRATLGAPAITRTPTGYALGAITSDAERFLDGGDLRLWRGAYLEDLGELSARGETRHRLLAALRSGVAAARDPALAVRAARVLVDMEPYDEDALRTLLKALRSSNNRRDLTRAYAAGRARLLEVGVTLPESWQVFVAGT
jgi:DNA-binding SARP family transcriptional activator